MDVDVDMTEGAPSPDTPDESRDLAHLVRLPKPVRYLCEACCFVLVTLILLADLVTDVWVIAVYGMRRHVTFMALSVFFWLFCSVVNTVMYAVQMRTEGTQQLPVMVGCMFLNFPLQLGVTTHRLLFGLKKCDQCCVSRAGGEQGGRQVTTQEWTFSKLKLIHSMFQSAPQLMINILHMLAYGNIHSIQYISALISFASMVAGPVIHEKVRKERVRNAPFGLPATMCILSYKILILGARTLALVSFIYYFGIWVGAVLLPHFIVVMGFFTYLYRQVWKVQYYKICLHSLFCLMAYFPIHSEYRPEGEIVLFYALFTVENIIMMCLPYGPSPVHVINPIYKAGTRYYIAMTLTVLICTVGGLIFMSIYYFFFHRSRQTIRHTHLGWLARICEWANKPGGQDMVRDERDHVRLYVEDGEGSAKPGDEKDRLTQQTATETTQTVNYRPQSVTSGGFQVLRDADVDRALLEDETLKYVDAGAGGRLLISDIASPDVDCESASRPSVLEGDDEDSDHDASIDRRPITSITV